MSFCKGVHRRQLINKYTHQETKMSYVADKKERLIIKPEKMLSSLISI